MTLKENQINKIIKDNRYAEYLELGYQNGENFNKIECENKQSVDVNGKADFNDGDLKFFEQNEKVFDCIFVDSLHESEHVRKVISESLKCLSEKGCIVLHDVLPPTLESQLLPRVQKVFCGDVWRAAVGFVQNYPDVKVETYRADFGLTVIYPNGKKVKKHFENKEMTFEEFKANEFELLNIID